MQKERNLTNDILNDAKLLPPPRALHLMTAVACLCTSSMHGKDKLSALMLNHADGAKAALQRKLQVEKAKNDKMEDGAKKAQHQQKTLSKLLRKARKRYGLACRHRLMGTIPKDCVRVMQVRFTRQMQRLLEKAALVCEGAGRRTITANDIRLVANLMKFRSPVMDELGLWLDELGSYAKGGRKERRGKKEAEEPSAE